MDDEELLKEKLKRQSTLFKRQKTINLEIVKLSKEIESLKNKTYKGILKSTSGIWTLKFMIRKIKKTIRRLSPFYKKAKLARTSKGWYTYDIRVKKIRPIKMFFENLSDKLTPYPFNHIGLKNLKYWFLYRFHPKHKYNIIKIGKPDYYSEENVIELCLTNERILNSIKQVIDCFNDEVIFNLQKPRINEPLQTLSDRSTHIQELRQAYIFFKETKPRIQKKIEKRWNFREHERKILGKTAIQFFMERDYSKKELAITRNNQKLESLLYEKTDKNLANIIKNRKYIWN